MHFELQQLEEITSILESSGLEYWLDSGTLLGLVRESKLLPRDPDIDISLWAGQEAQLDDALRRLRGLGYSISTFWYRQGRYGGSYKLVPRRHRNRAFRSVDIKVFRRCGTHACCVGWNGIRLESSFLLVRGGWRIARGIAWRTWRYLFPNASPERGILSKFVELHYWVVPEVFFSGIVRHHTGFPIPEAYDEYLSARYGLWRVPRTDWHYSRDDPFFVKRLPWGEHIGR